MFLLTVAALVIGTLVTIQVMPVRKAPAAPSTGAGASPVQPGSSPDTPGVPAQDAIADPFAAAGSCTMPAATVSSPAGASVTALEDVISAAIPAVVSIETPDGRGSGFFAAPRTVVTNRHVVGTSISVKVRLASGTMLSGRVQAVSPDFDLALVRVDDAPASQAVLALGSVGHVRPGQEVIAIGLALGMFQNTVTRGIVSAIRCAGAAVVIQTDAAINHGNSGGPLINRSGQVIGINSMKIAGNAESLGFAIAIDHTRSLLNDAASYDATVPRANESSPPAPSVTPASAAAPLITPSFNGRTPPDDGHDAGARAYDETVKAVSQRASELDDYWTRIKANCAVRVAPGYDREWFGFWEGRAELTTPDPSCAASVRELNQLSAEVRTKMIDARETARHAGVLPGQLRDTRHRYRMDWPGFDR